MEIVYTTERLKQIIESVYNQGVADGRRDRENREMMDQFAETAIAMGEDQSISRSLEQIDEMFPDVVPASKSFIQGKLHNWGAEPYVHVGYTHCRVGDDESLFRELAKPLPNGNVMFAGEAYVSEGANMTVHSALDAGTRASREVATYLSRREFLSRAKL